MIFEDQHGSSTLQGIASLLNAVAWPTLIAVLVFCYRGTLGSILPIFVEKFRSAGTVELAGIKLTLAQQEIQHAVQNVAIEPPGDSVPEVQVKSAQDLEMRLAASGFSASETVSVIEVQVVQLATEYENLRETMDSGSTRTIAMNEVMGKMRTLGIRLSPLLNRMALSRRQGERLAPIASLQVQPDGRYTRWLTERLYVEVPHIFFHASLALSETVHKWGLPEDLRSELQKALNHISSHSVPDQNTIRVLRQVLREHLRAS